VDYDTPNSDIFTVSLKSVSMASASAVRVSPHPPSGGGGTILQLAEEALPGDSYQLILHT